MSLLPSAPPSFACKRQLCHCVYCCCCAQGRFEAAIRDYTQAIQLNPGHCRAYYNRAFSHDRLGQFEEAVADYSRALQIEPANATALHNRGSLFERMGRCVKQGRQQGSAPLLLAHKCSSVLIGERQLACGLRAATSTTPNSQSFSCAVSHLKID